MNDHDRQQRDAGILDVVRRIPEGRVSSYGRIADMAGVPRGARLVGRLLSELPADTDVPWHRVLNAAGRLHSTPGTTSARKQRDRLLEEGVIVRNDRVDMRCFCWQYSADEAIWGMPPGE